MPIKRYKPEQIVTMLRQIEVSIANGKTTLLSRPVRQSPVCSKVAVFCTFEAHLWFLGRVVKAFRVNRLIGFAWELQFAAAMPGLLLAALWGLPRPQSTNSLDS
jgi:hypothetical protein